MRRVAKELEGAQNLDPDVARGQFEEAVEEAYGSASDRELAGLTMEWAEMARQHPRAQGQPDGQSQASAERRRFRSNERPLWEIEGIGNKRSEKLREQGVSTTLQLLKTDLNALSEASGIPRSRLQRWREDAQAYHAGESDTSISPTKKEQGNISSNAEPSNVSVDGSIGLLGKALIVAFLAGAVYGVLWGGFGLAGAFGAGLGGILGFLAILAPLYIIYRAAIWMSHL